MNDIVIKAENLGKKYIIGHQAENGRYVALRDVLMHNVQTLWNKTKDLATGKPIIQGDTMEEVWALKDLNFEIKRGEAVGIIGRNGAGKSTLLKILSRITELTTGRVTIKGRVASLLEVGTGFHPELSGRENIYLNGTILGMTRVEIKRKFDEIVAFAEIEKFLDTPVKRYSSGMYVRLAFAGAAHLEPEILVVDEVLAVGDAQFQKKCLGKMEEVGEEGRTVIFVSHNMGSIQRLCKKALYLDRGGVKALGDVSIIIDQYMNATSTICKTLLCDRVDRTGSGNIRLTSVTCHSSSVNSIEVVRGPDLKVIEISYEVLSENECRNVNVAIGVDDILGNRIITLWSKYNNEIFNNLPLRGTFVCQIPQLNLRTGSYFIHVYLEANGVVADYVHNAYELAIEYGRFYASGLEPTGDQGALLIEHCWSIRS